MDASVLQNVVLAYLMNEKIDTSVKFERYHLMNNIYCSIYNYTKNIKPGTRPILFT